MPTIFTEDNRPSTQDTSADRKTLATMTGGSSLEIVGGVIAVVLAIIALTGYMPRDLTAIAAIAAGAALLAHGASVAARWNETVARMPPEHKPAAGIGSEVLGGIGGIVLGILALAGVLPMTLLPVAAIIFGVSVLLGAFAQPQLARFAPDSDARIGRITYEAVETTSGGMILAGIAAVVLGILALVRVGPALELTDVALLAVGGALLLTGVALTARFARRMKAIHA